MTFRTEKDSLGELSVPADAYFGIHTQRSLQNFPISGKPWHPKLISAIVQLKLACAQANHELGLLSAEKTTAMVQACHEINEGKFADQFPVDIFQAGSGTSTNMNVNEVIANRANELRGSNKGLKSPVHPHDDVNKGQSTNNVIPSAIRITALDLVNDLLDGLTQLKKELEKKASAFVRVGKAGRTHLQDAVPITLGQEFTAYATAIQKHIERLKQTKTFLCELGIGGNAVGTGINTYPEFRATIIRYLNASPEQSKQKVTEEYKVTSDGIESTQFLTDLAALSGLLNNLAIDLNKIANDLRLMASGPTTGFNEITLPAVEPGSSIMPGKINPSIPEAMNMVCYRVMGNNVTITMAATAGNLELNTHMPLIGNTLLESLEILTNAVRIFTNKCIIGITVNKEQCAWYFEHSLAVGTAFNPYLGYDLVAALVKEARRTGIPLKDLVVEKNLLNKEKVAAILDPESLTRPNLPKDLPQKDRENHKS
ncbi:aspartate ammonia-lyase [Candidatus Woesearchaeota archaeon]|nr:aspartate ammonia-lyase [Candidatus Woesearchaeota archaeon]